MTDKVWSSSRSPQRAHLLPKIGLLYTHHVRSATQFDALKRAKPSFCLNNRRHQNNGIALPSGIAATFEAARGFRGRVVRAAAHHPRHRLRRMAPRPGLAGRGCGQAGAGREARQRDPEHADALRLRHHIQQLETGGELPAPRTHHRRAGGHWVLAEVGLQLRRPYSAATGSA